MSNDFLEGALAQCYVCDTCNKINEKNLFKKLADNNHKTD